jgi:hypothetical protein
VPFGEGSYEIRIKGRLSDSLLTAFEGLTATVEPVEPVLHGPVADQSSLHGLLDRIQSLAWSWSRSGGSPHQPESRRWTPSHRRDTPWTPRRAPSEFHPRPSGSWY